jgi:hypothetical protein
MSRSRELSELATAYDSGSPFGFRNRIINGDCRIDQRNAGASVAITTSDNYTLDRWQGTASANSRYTIQQNAASVTPPTGFTSYLGATSVSSGAPGSTDSYLISQFIEGLNVADLGWGTASAATVTLSFWVRSSLTGSFGGTITNSAGNRSYPFGYTISSANTWEQKTITIAGDTSGTWLTTNGIGLRLRFSMGMGSSYLGTANTWAGSFIGAPTGSTNVIATNGATWYVTGVQLEKGSTATSFDYRPYGTELALCQRYFETIDVSMRAYTSDGFFAIPSVFKVTKRATPTVTWVSNTTSNLTGAPASVGTQTVNNYSAQWSGLSAGTYYTFPTAFTVASEL